MAIAATKGAGTTLVDVIDRVLDKGLVINADITITLVGVELLGIKIKAAVASFETAIKYGLMLPSGTDTSTEAWKRAMHATEDCPQCAKRVPVEELLHENCPWCGWMSAKNMTKARAKTYEGALVNKK